MTLKDYHDNAQFNMNKSINSIDRAMGLGQLRFYTKAKLLGAEDTDSWYDWEDKVLPDLTILRDSIYKEAIEKREKELENNTK